jgi:hypothetical protein
MSDLFFRDIYSKTMFDLGGWGMYMWIMYWRGGYGRINSWSRVFELAADTWEAMHGKGACYSSTILLTSNSPKGGATRHHSHEVSRDGRSGEVWRPHEQPPLESPVRRVYIIFAPPRPCGSGHCDHTQRYRYPLSLGTPNSRECEPG